METIMLMKRIFPLLLPIFCISVVFAGYTDGFITEGEYEGGVIWTNNDPPLIVDGGGANTIELYDNGRLEVHSTSKPLDLLGGGVYDISRLNDGTLLYLNGVTNSIRLAGNATAVLKGGSINFIVSLQNVGYIFVGYDGQGKPVFERDKHIEMVVKTHIYDSDIQMLTGTWANNDTFEIKLLDQPGYDPVIDNIKFTIIPEPTTLLLLTLGGLLIRPRQ